MAEARKYDALALALIGVHLGLHDRANQYGFNPPSRLKNNALLVALVLDRIIGYRERRIGITFVEAKDIRLVLKELKLPVSIRIVRECLHWMEEEHFVDNILKEIGGPFKRKRYIPTLKHQSLMKGLRYKITQVERALGDSCRGY